MDEFTIVCARCHFMIKAGGNKISHGYCQKCFDILIKEEVETCETSVSVEPAKNQINAPGIL